MGRSTSPSEMGTNAKALQSVCEEAPPAQPASAALPAALPERGQASEASTGLPGSLSLFGSPTVSAESPERVPDANPRSPFPAAGFQKPLQL